MKFSEQKNVSLTPLGDINQHYLADEKSLVAELVELADAGKSSREKVQGMAATLVRAVRRNSSKEGGIDAFLQQYDLSSEEGVLLMCIAEALLQREVFGPVLHVLRYRGSKLAEAVDSVNATGYGLTMGLHSRIDGRARALARVSGAGNIYVNRNMIGAVVGVQPFGGRGLSGTGPKAGGPHYLPRFGSEYTVSNNISAVGGNATLLALGE
jgi:acyl-CoA reductase-like NAD-dependent aldehyde dehydrogenase